MRATRLVAVPLAALAVLTGCAGAPGFDSTGIPVEYRALVKRAANTCPQIPRKVFAAQIAQESKWNPRAVSSAGAEGIAQILPSTWKHYGIDGNGDGVADVWDSADSLMTAAKINCLNFKWSDGIPGDHIDNTLAAYNAGHSNVAKYQGVPPFGETQDYVRRIRQNAPLMHP